MWPYQQFKKSHKAWPFSQLSSHIWHDWPVLMVGWSGAPCTTPLTSPVHTPYLPSQERAGARPGQRSWRGLRREGGREGGRRGREGGEGGREGGREGRRDNFINYTHLTDPSYKPHPLHHAYETGKSSFLKLIFVLSRHFSIKWWNSNHNVCLRDFGHTSFSMWHTTLIHLAIVNGP